MIFIVAALPYWWVLPICGVIVGWTTNLLGHAADLRAGRAAADRPVHASRPLPAAPQRGRRRLLADHRRGRRHPRTTSATTCSTGRARTAPARCSRRRCARPSTRPPGRRARPCAWRSGRRSTTRSATRSPREAVDYTMTPFTDPEFNRRQAARIKELFESRMRELPNRDFVELLRSAIKEDEWMLTRTAPCSGSAPACYTWRSSESELMSDDRQPADGAGLGPVENLARLGAGAWWRTARWGVGTSPARRGAAAGRRRPRGPDDRRGRGVPGRRRSPTRRRPCASAASGCWRSRRTWATSRARTRPTSGSSPTWRPTRRGSCRLIAERGPQPAVDVRSGARLRPGLAPDRPGLLDDRRRGGLPVRRPGTRLPLATSTGSGLIWFSREPVARQRALPGARGPAGRARGPRRGGALLARRPPLDRHDAAGQRLLPRSRCRSTRRSSTRSTTQSRRSSRARPSARSGRPLRAECPVAVQRRLR